MEMLVPLPLVASMGHLVKREEASLSRLLRGFDGEHDLSFQLAWRDDCVRPPNHSVCRLGPFPVKESSPSDRPCAVCILVLGFLVFDGKEQVPGRLGDRRLESV